MIIVNIAKTIIIQRNCRYSLTSDNHNLNVLITNLLTKKLNNNIIASIKVNWLTDINHNTNKNIPIKLILMIFIRNMAKFNLVKYARIPIIIERTINIIILKLNHPWIF